MGNKKKTTANPADTKSADRPRKSAPHRKKKTKLTVDALSRVSISDLTPVVQRLLGVAANGSADRETYRAHLHKKYSGE